MIDTLRNIHRLVLSNFREKADLHEEWRMPEIHYNGTQVIKDDCDGFCLAVRFLLRKKSIASRLVYCEVDGGGHLVVEASGWILDNRQKTVVSNRLLRALNYRFLRISGYMPGDPWHEIVN